MNRITDESLNLKIKALKEAKSQFTEVEKDAKAADLKAIRLFSNLPDDCGFFDSRTTYFWGETIQSNITANPEGCAQGLDGFISDLRGGLNRLQRANSLPELGEKLSHLIAFLETLHAKLRDVLEKRSAAEAEVEVEMLSLRKAIADFWWERRDQAFVDIRAALKSYCSDPKDLNDAANVCTLPRELFHRAAGFSTQYTNWKFDRLRLADDVKQIKAAISALE